MASESRPSRRPAAQHAATADLVLEAPSMRVQAGSDRGRTHTSVGGVGAVSEPSLLTRMRMQWVMVKLVLWLTRTAWRQVLGKMAWQQECILGLTRTPRLQVLGMSPRRPASSTSSVSLAGCKSCQLWLLVTGIQVNVSPSGDVEGDLSKAVCP